LTVIGIYAEMRDSYNNDDRAMYPGKPIIRFGIFEVDLVLGEVRKAGSRVKLQEQPFKILQILLEHPGDLVTREELQSRIWPDENFGDFDHAINVAVGKLRTVLGDSIDASSFIQTVPRRGYRFVAKLEDGVSITAKPRENEHGVTTVALRHRRVLLVILVASVSGILFGLGAFLGHREARSQDPNFQRLTFRRGTIYCARFAPDGRDVIYSASWDGAPVEIFSTDPRITGARDLGLRTTELLAVSRLGELAVLQSLDYPFLLTVRGTLARVPLTEGSPRQIEKNIDWADWSANGQTLAIVNDVAGEERLEFPPGRVLYRTAGWISHIRISPKGDRIAFLDHESPGDDRGSVSIVDLAGHRKVLSGGWESEEGLAWSADGREVWFSAARAGIERRVYAVDLSGHQRLILRAPVGVTLQDIAPDGRVLLTRDEQHIGIMALAPGERKEHELSWLGWSVPTALSPDGKTLLFDEQGEEAGAQYTVALWEMQESPPIPLGDGMAGDLSPNGKWATTVVSNTRLLLLPTGAGTAIRIERDGIERYWSEAHWMPDGEQIIFSANLPGHAPRCFIQSVRGGQPRAITGEGITFCASSPDGKLIAGSSPSSGETRLYRIDGGEAQPVAGLLPGESFVWTSDPQFMYVYQQHQVPVRIYRLNVFTGQRRLFRELNPSDTAGLSEISRVLFSSDGRADVYSYVRFLSVLYMVTGLK
jgi:eukaryotic-like serine/threonine-protein kinase